MLAKRIIPCLDIKDSRTVKGVNFVDLIDAGVQLRVENSDSAQTTAKLYHIFANHTRMIKGSESGIEVEF